MGSLENWTTADAQASGANSLLPCEVCRQPSPSSCANCVKVNYCSKDHQRQDWKRHRTECFPGLIAQNEVIGRHLVASRPIRAGEVILTEDPIISGPNGRAGIHPLCLACYQQMKDENENCTKCRWPIHFKCQKNPIHAQECQIFAKNYMKPFSKREVHMYEKVLVLRCLLLKNHHPSYWTRIRDLQSHATERHKTHKGQLLSKSAIEFIHKVCQLIEFNSEEIDHVLGVLATNAFVTEDNMGSASAQCRFGSYLFYYGSMPAHDCIPNGKWQINGKSKYVLRALRNISKGESITQPYSETILGTLERRRHLQESKYFACCCFRCSDPSELGSNFSGVTCHHCCSGYLLPTNSLDEFSEWRCSTGSSCPLTSVQAIQTLLAKVRKEKDEIEDENSLAAVLKLETLRTKFTPQLHANHYLIHEIEQEILQRTSYILASETSSIRMNSGGKKKQQAKDGMRLNLANRLVELSRKNLQLLEVIAPGLTTHRGRQLYFLQQGLGVLLTNAKNGSFKKQIVSEFQEARANGVQILETETEFREEFLLAKQMKHDKFNFE